MKIGIMQPYFFPYIGYWQLMNYVDRYVVYDDVNYIKGGWINRNRILVNGEPKFINVQLLGASPNKLIKEVGVNNDVRIINKNLRMIENAYSKAPEFETAYELIRKALYCGRTTVSEYIFESFKIINDYLDIKTEIMLSSELDKVYCDDRQGRLVNICRILGGDEYVNAIGGQSLYTKEGFAQYGIKLNFLKSNEVIYNQFDDSFVSGLSIIDLIMFNKKEVVKQFLNDFTLI